MKGHGGDRRSIHGWQPVFRQGTRHLDASAQAEFLVTLTHGHQGIPDPNQGEGHIDPETAPPFRHHGEIKILLDVRGTVGMEMGAAFNHRRLPRPIDQEKAYRRRLAGPKILGNIGAQYPTRIPVLPADPVLLLILAAIIEVLDDQSWIGGHAKDDKGRIDD